ncbi:MAG: hypothetical protein GXO32_03230 [Crenarchaeota archaeon]|nr:hypothetical protein [Thermoproteota archaeon]
MSGSQSQEVAGAQARKPKHIDVIVDILAFFAAQKRYSYVDMIGNALDKLLAIDALKDAVRDFKSSCIDQTIPDEEVVCPKIGPEEIDNATRWVTDKIRNAETHEFLLFTRELAVKALARAPRFKKENLEESPSSSSQESKSS